jgi:hypothetical protein
MIRILAYVIIIPLILLVLFFGMGPVLLADGSSTERLTTFIIVAVILAGLVYALFKFTKLKR